MAKSIQKLTQKRVLKKAKVSPPQETTSVVESFCKFVQNIDALVKRRQHLADRSEQVVNGQNRMKLAAKSVAKKNKSTKKGAK